MKIITEWKKLNRNVKLIFIFTFFNYSGVSLYGSSFLAIYVYILSNNSHPMVGYMSFIKGMVLLILAFPAGCLTDRILRQNVLKISGLIGIISLILGIIVFQLESLHVMYAFVATLGAYNAFNNTAIESIFADSTNSNERTKLFAYKHALMMTSLTIGPVIACILVKVVGNEWSLRVMYYPLMVGICLSIPAVFSLFFFKDQVSSEILSQDAVELIVVSNQESNFDMNNNISSSSDNDTNNDTANMKQVNDKDSLENEKDINNNDINYKYIKDKDINVKNINNNDINDVDDDELKTNDKDNDLVKYIDIGSNKSLKYVALMLALSDFMTAIGAGMTIQYFPIFFRELFNPFGVQLIYASSSISTAAASLLVRIISTHTNRIVGILIARAIGILMLVLICVLRFRYIAALLFVFRTAFMNSTKPLSRSLLMEHVEKKRGQWNSAESISMFTWTGSALAGGYIVDKYGYYVNFLATAGIYVVGLIPVIYLWIQTFKLSSSIKGYAQIESNE